MKFASVPRKGSKAWLGEESPRSLSPQVAIFILILMLIPLGPIPPLIGHSKWTLGSFLLVRRETPQMTQHIST